MSYMQYIASNMHAVLLFILCWLYNGLFWIGAIHVRISVKVVFLTLGHYRANDVILKNII